MAAAGDDVEARSAKTPRLAAQPGPGAADQACLLARMDRLFGSAEGVGTARLHLHEHHQPTPRGHQVELDPSGADVAVENAVAPADQQGGGAGLALGAEAAGVLGHGSPNGTGIAREGTGPARGMPDPYPGARRGEG